MKTRFVSSIGLPLAGALALMVTGCGSMHERSADRSTMVEPAGYIGQTYSTSTPAKMDPFSRSYVPFPASASDTAGIIGHSPFCLEHYNQPGCQTVDNMGGRHFSRNERTSRGYYGDGWRGPVNPDPDTRPENAQGINSPRR